MAGRPRALESPKKGMDQLSLVVFFPDGFSSQAEQTTLEFCAITAFKVTGTHQYADHVSREFTRLNIYKSQEKAHAEH